MIIPKPHTGNTNNMSEKRKGNSYIAISPVAIGKNIWGKAWVVIGEWRNSHLSWYQVRSKVPGTKWGTRSKIGSRARYSSWSGTRMLAVRGHIYLAAAWIVRKWSLLSFRLTLTAGYCLISLFQVQTPSSTTLFRGRAKKNGTNTMMHKGESFSTARNGSLTLKISPCQRVWKSGVWTTFKNY